MRKIFSFKIGVAARASEAGMYGSSEFLAVYVERNSFSASGGGCAFVAMAGETLRSRLVGGAYGTL
jgi:hypothetical protein